MNGRHSAQVDALTGAWRRDFFLQALIGAVAAAKQQRLTLGVLYLDVDDLQEQNDLHGAEAVDAALARVVEVIAERLEGRSPIGRLEGGGFAAFLLNVESEALRSTAEDIRVQAERLRWPWGNEGTPLTVSLGLATLRPLDAVWNVLEAAEDACRRAKQGGRNRVASR